MSGVRGCEKVVGAVDYRSQSPENEFQRERAKEIKGSG